MTDEQWRTFFVTCARVLAGGRRGAARGEDPPTLCAWTTFGKLHDWIHYWTCELPGLDEIAEAYIKDGGTWGQPFSFADLAHIVLPREFVHETGERETYCAETRTQDIERLSEALTGCAIPHRLTDIVLEIKLY